MKNLHDVLVWVNREIDSAQKSFDDCRCDELNKAIICGKLDILKKLSDELNFHIL